MCCFIYLIHDIFSLNSDITTHLFTADKIKKLRGNQSSDDHNGSRTHYLQVPPVLYAKAVDVHNGII